MAPPSVTRAYTVLMLVTLAVSLTGCLTEQPTNETVHPAVNPVNVTHTYYYVYNGTSYLTGIIRNVGTQSLVDVSIQAEGYANNTMYERGYAGPETGINSTILPGQLAPFMIKMLPVTVGSASTTPFNQTHVASANRKAATSTRNITANNSKTNTNTQQAKKYNLRYRILPPDYKLSNNTPYPLSITNNKTFVLNKTIRGVSGEVYNGGTDNVNSSVVAIALYRKDGNVLGVFAGKPLGGLAPEKTAPFQIDIPSSFSISSKGVTRIEIYAYEFPG
jgi:hypothetical protein